jgi:hypothetical protein
MYGKRPGRTKVKMKHTVQSPRDNIFKDFHVLIYTLLHKVVCMSGGMNPHIFNLDAWRR